MDSDFLPRHRGQLARMSTGVDLNSIFDMIHASGSEVDLEREETQ